MHHIPPDVPGEVASGPAEVSRPAFRRFQIDVPQELAERFDEVARLTMVPKRRLLHKLIEEFCDRELRRPAKKSAVHKRR